MDWKSSASAQTGSYRLCFFPRRLESRKALKLGHTSMRSCVKNDQAKFDESFVHVGGQTKMRAV